MTATQLAPPLIELSTEEQAWLGEHGFRHIMTLYRRLPAYEMQYGCLEDLNDSLGEITAELCRNNN